MLYRGYSTNALRESDLQGYNERKTSIYRGRPLVIVEATNIDERSARPETWCRHVSAAGRAFLERPSTY